MAASSPAFLFSTSRIVSGYVGGTPARARHAWSGDWTWHKTVKRNDVISREAHLKDLIEHQTEPRDPADLPRGLLQPGRRQVAGPIAVLSHRTRYAREQAASTRKCAPALRPRKEMRRRTSSMPRKCAAPRPRYWERREEGELPVMFKGPMTVTGFIAYAQGWGWPVAPTSWPGN